VISTKKNYSNQIVKLLQKFGLPLILFLIYLLLPSHNSTTDGWGYAEEIKHGYNLFRPHHLLYNALGYILIKATHFLGFHPDILSTMKVLNAVVAFSIMLVLRQLLTSLRLSEKKQNIWLLFTGSSFGIWRFATENEVYLLPILGSLMASYWFLLFLQNGKNKTLIYSSFFASLACLFHQLHIFWWLALLIGFILKKKKNARLYLAISLIIPISYLATVLFYEGKELTLSNTLLFVLHDYLTDSAEVSIGLNNILLTPVNLFRTMFQVHGNILLILDKYPWFYGFLIASITLAVASLYFGTKIRINKKASNDLFFKIHLFAFTLQLFFAFFSHGNAEFMVVMIVILPILVHKKMTHYSGMLLFLSLSMFIWNFAFAAFPNYRFNYTNDAQTIQFIEKHPNAIFILKEKNTIANRYAYETDLSVSHRLYSFPFTKNLDQLCTLQNSGITIYTDILSKKMPFNRAKWLGHSKNEDSMELIEKGNEEIPSFYGPFTIDKIRIKCEQR